MLDFAPLLCKIKHEKEKKGDQNTGSNVLDLNVLIEKRICYILKMIL